MKIGRKYVLIMIIKLKVAKLFANSKVKSSNNFTKLKKLIAIFLMGFLI